MKIVIPKIRSTLHILLWVLVASFSDAARAGDRPSFIIPEAAPKSALKVDSMGPGDPYPRADQLERHNGIRLLHTVASGGDFSGFVPWDHNYAFYDGSEPPQDVRKKKMWAALGENVISCKPMDSTTIAPGVQYSEDLHDFVVSLPALQAELATKGLLFAPVGTRNWQLLTYSTYLDGILEPPKGYFRTQYQTFYRVVGFVTTADSDQLRDAVAKLSQLRGYVQVPQPKGDGVYDKDAFFLEQIVTPNVVTKALVGIDRVGPGNEIDTGYHGKIKLPNGFLQNCLVTDDFGKTWLGEINPKTGLRYKLEDVRFGGLAQIANLPLGASTEYYTIAHIEPKLAKQLRMSPEQLQAYRDALEERAFREAAKRSPEFSQLLKKAEQINSQVAAAEPQDHVMVDELRTLGHKVVALMHLSPAADKTVDDVADNLDAMVTRGARVASDAADYVSRRLKSFWE